MAKILVTGAKGQLGKSIHNETGGCPDHQFFFTDLPDLDLSDNKKTEDFIKAIRPDYLIHCAAYTDVDRAEEDRETAFRINAEVPALLGSLSGKYNFSMFHLSTDYVFKGDAHSPYTETCTPSPVSVYGESKLAGEQALTGTPAIIIRTAWLYSAYGHNFVKTIVSFAREKDKVRVVYDQVGSPTYAPDLAKAILEIIEKVESTSASWMPGIYHYAGEGVCSWYDMAEEIVRFLSLPGKIEPVRSSEFPRPAPRPPYSILAKEKIKQTFSLQIPYWKESLQQCLPSLKPEKSQL